MSNIYEKNNLGIINSAAMAKPRLRFIGWDVIGARTELCQAQQSVSSIIDLSIDENISRQTSLECHLASTSPQSPWQTAPGASLSRLESWGSARASPASWGQGMRRSSRLCRAPALAVCHHSSLWCHRPSPGQPRLWHSWHKGDLERRGVRALSLNSSVPAGSR